MRIVAAPAVKVVRDGKETEISVEEIVLDDVMKLETGVQICADAVVLEGQTEVNESMLTGESESVVKKREIICLRAAMSFRAPVLQERTK